MLCLRRYELRSVGGVPVKVVIAQSARDRRRRLFALILPLLSALIGIAPQLRWCSSRPTNTQR